MIAQQHHLVEDLERAGVRVFTAARVPAGTARIHVIAWEELPRRNTDNSLRLVVITDRAGEPEQREAARRGAAALIAVDHLREDLGPVIWCVTAGYYPMPHSIVPTMVSRLEAPPPNIGEDNLALLSRLLRGANTAELAAALGCSERHARRRLRTLWNQMGVSGRREGLATAVRWGLPH
ncbi:MAG: hypothetical protein QNL12_03785 [Acidimicrobiia bacterium]|nr:hypothetical protein [Acidimicrobiia bacterium]MDX2466411.1 hypothetical protein [Acidimicrobiia bacterium]